MPVNNNWRVEAGDFHYKAQDFRNSCFPACLQMALKNFGLIHEIQTGQPGRPIENEFNDFFTRTYHKNMDIVAPTRAVVEEFMLRVQHRHHILVEYIERITTLNQERIMGLIFGDESVAIIGAMASAFGHAAMIFNREGQVFVANPDPRVSPYCARVEDLVKIRFDYTGAPGPAGEYQLALFCEDVYCPMEYCYIVTPVM